MSSDTKTRGSRGRWGGRESAEIRRKIRGDAKKWMEHVGPWILPRSVERELQGGREGARGGGGEGVGGREAKRIPGRRI